MFLAKGSSAQVYTGIPLGGADLPPVAIKLARDPALQPEVAQQLMDEAAMIAQVGSRRPQAVCRLYHQPTASDPKLKLADGRPQPVFIAMELVSCDFHELDRVGALSMAATFEAFLLSLQALRDVHQSGLLHRDIKLNNIAFAVDQHRLPSADHRGRQRKQRWSQRSHHRLR